MFDRFTCLMIHIYVCSCVIKNDICMVVCDRLTCLMIHVHVWSPVVYQLYLMIYVVMCDKLNFLCPACMVTCDILNFNDTILTCDILTFLMRHVWACVINRLFEIIHGHV